MDKAKTMEFIVKILKQYQMKIWKHNWTGMENYLLYKNIHQKRKIYEVYWKYKIKNWRIISKVFQQ